MLSLIICIYVKNTRPKLYLTGCNNHKILHYTGILLLCNEYRDIFLYRFRLCDFCSKSGHTIASGVLVVLYVILEYGFCGEYTLIWLYIGQEISKARKKSISVNIAERGHTRWKNIHVRIATITGFKTHRHTLCKPRVQDGNEVFTYRSGAIISTLVSTLKPFILQLQTGMDQQP